ncbi:MAG TPA: M15 family metallopeptidase, partial [Longimicrobium sp.]|nr:M15 family metallopeptidase [Longimicrobium sp.]
MTSERRMRIVLAAAAVIAGGCGTTATNAPPAATAPSPAPLVRTAARTPECQLPAGAELVDVTRVDPSIRTDIRYATANNFTGRALPGYESARALLRPGAARALARVQARLRPGGVGLKVYDAYRPIRATQA